MVFSYVYASINLNIWLTSAIILFTKFMNIFFTTTN